MNILPMTVLFSVHCSNELLWVQIGGGLGQIEKRF